jgi:ABC-type uncharacterized transport system permease subunit
MKSNENGIERVIRVILGIGALVAAFMSLGVMDGEIVGIIVAVVGAVLLLTGTVGFCPAYRLVGISTCKKGSCGDSCGCSND